MRNKKGFVFVETIVVCSILAVSLVTIYAAFVLLVNDQKKRNKYDQAIYNYRLYNIAKELNDSLGGNCNNSYNNIKDQSKLFSDLESLYFVKADSLDSWTPVNYNQLLEYKKTINFTPNTCLLIGEFKKYNYVTNKTEYYYANVTIKRNG